MRGIALRLTLANSSAISGGSDARISGIVAGAMEMPQVRLIFCAAVPEAGRAALSGTKYSTWGKDIPENTRPGAGGEMEGR